MSKGEALLLGWTLYAALLATVALLVLRDSDGHD
jgi:hypothetical protein